jgi:hypothetical protein
MTWTGVLLGFLGLLFVSRWLLIGGNEGTGRRRKGDATPS